MFKFGIETEYLIYDKQKQKALWHKDLNFHDLYQMIESIDLGSEINVVGLDPEDAHSKILPYVVEGYHIKNENNEAIDMMAKGLEIRSPVCCSIDEVIQVQKLLFEKLENAAKEKGYGLACVSHHPYEYSFDGPRCNRRHDFWLWAKEVMTTYGPDINIKFPDEVSKKLFGNKVDFERKLNYYAPALTALTLNSPFFEGSLMYHHCGKPMKSIRTFRRSTIAPLIEWHANEDDRIEFKFFEMTKDWSDYEAYFLACLGLGLCDELQGRALDQQRIYQMGDVALNGLDSDFIKFVIDEFMTKVPKVLEQYGFSTETLKNLCQRSETPADVLIHQFKSGKPIEAILFN